MPGGRRGEPVALRELDGFAPASRFGSGYGPGADTPGPPAAPYRTAAYCPFEAASAILAVVLAPSSASRMMSA